MVSRTKRTLKRRQHNKTRAKSKKRLNRKQLGGMVEAAPRIIILDNDETTGSYWPLFELLHFFEANHIKDIYFEGFIPHLTEFCINAHIFRPGIEQLVNTIHSLKEEGKLDKIIMYTFQTQTINDIQQLSVPSLINYCFGYIASGKKTVRPFFDTVITRAEHNAAYGAGPAEMPTHYKSIDVVFKEGRINPTHDLRGITFIDDCYANFDYPAEINNQQTLTGPFSAVYISKYALSDKGILIQEAEQLYSKYLRIMFTDTQYVNYINHIKEYSYKYHNIKACSPENVNYIYDDMDIIPLVNDIRKYYMRKL